MGRLEASKVLFVPNYWVFSRKVRSEKTSIEVIPPFWADRDNQRNRTPWIEWISWWKVRHHETSFSFSWDLIDLIDQCLNLIKSEYKSNKNHAPVNFNCRAMQVARGQRPSRLLQPDPSGINPATRPMAHCYISNRISLKFMLHFLDMRSRKTRWATRR